MEVDSIPRLIETYTAIKRGYMMHDMLSLYKDFLPPTLTARSVVYKSQAQDLVDVVTSMQDSYLKEGIACGTLTQEDAKPLFTSDCDKDWLMEQIDNDVLVNTYNIWQLPGPKASE